MFNLLFDFDGTLFDSNAAHKSAYIQTFEKFKIGQAPDYELIKGQKTIEVINKYVKDKIKIEEIVRYKSSTYQSNIAEVQALCSIEKLIKLKEKNCSFYIVSGGSRSSIEKVLNHHQIENLFDGIIAAEDYACSKPDPECFLTCLKKFHIQGPTKGIEDSIHGIESLKRAGIEAIGVHNPSIKHHSDRYFHHLDLFLDELLLIA